MYILALDGMPPKAVKTLRDLLYWQYAKIISESAGFGKSNYRFIMDRYKKLQTGDIEWSTSIREWIHEKENKETCIYCGAAGPLTVEHSGWWSCSGAGGAWRGCSAGRRSGCCWAASSSEA